MLSIHNKTEIIPNFSIVQSKVQIMNFSIIKNIILLSNFQISNLLLVFHNTKGTELGKLWLF